MPKQEEKRCGSCRFWERNPQSKSNFGFCTYDKMPTFAEVIPMNSMDRYLDVNDGTDCSAYQEREDNEAV